MVPHSRTLAWKIPQMEEPGRLQSMGSQRVGHDWVTSLSLLCIAEGNGNPLQCSCLENRDRGAWWAAVYGVTQSRTQLKWLSSSSSNIVVLNANFPSFSWQFCFQVWWYAKKTLFCGVPPLFKILLFFFQWCAFSLCIKIVKYTLCTITHYYFSIHWLLK